MLAGRNFAPFLRGVVFVGKASLGSSFDIKGISLGAVGRRIPSAA